MVVSAVFGFDFRIDARCVCSRKKVGRHDGRRAYDGAKGRCHEKQGRYERYGCDEGSRCHEGQWLYEGYRCHEGSRRQDGKAVKRKHESNLSSHTSLCSWGYCASAAL